MLQMPVRCSPCGYIVDFVRSCFASTWVLPTAGGQVVDGEFIFADPLAPAFPKGHWYGSREWIKGHDVEDRRYGQVVDAPEQWTPGVGGFDVPPATLLDTPCCTEPCDPGRKICGGACNVPRTVVIRVAFLATRYQIVYRLRDFAGGQAVWERVGPGAKNFSDCNPLFRPQGVIDLLWGQFATMSCASDDPRSELLANFPVILDIEGTSTAPSFFNIVSTVEKGIFPIFELEQDPNTYTLNCAGGISTDFQVTWAIFASEEDLVDGDVPEEGVDAGYMGFPNACWPLSPAPFGRPWPFSPVDRDWRLFAAEVLCFQYRDPPTAEAKLQAFLGPHYTIVRIDNDDGPIPGSIIAHATGRTIIFISGTTAPVQWAIQGAQSQLPPATFGNYATLPLWQMASDQMLSRLSAAGIGISDEVAIVGHSYGAAVAQLTAFRIASVFTRRRISLLTFAAPPVGIVPILGGFPHNVVSSFICNDGDPMTLVPPPFNTLISLPPFIPAVPLSAWNQWHRPRQTTRLSEDGSLRQDGEATVGFADLVIFLTAVLAGGPVAIGDAHLMPEYVRRLSLPNEPPTVCGRP